jgi:exonuclease III
VSKSWLVAIIILAFTCTACFARAQSMQVLTYNVQNLFDDTEDGSEYRDFKDLSAELYAQKVSNLVGGFDRIDHHYGKLDLILLQEVENNAVVDELIQRSQSLAGMSVIFAKEPSHATGLAILSRYEVLEAISLQVPDPLRNNNQLRPILIGVVQLPTGQPLILINVHLQSQSQAQNEHRRIASLMQLQRSLDELRRKYGKSVAVLIGGDFNMDLTDAPLLRAGIIEVAEESQLVEPEGFYNPWPAIASLALDKDFIGSYAFRGKWQALDGFLISHALLGAESSRFVTQEAVSLEYFLRRGLDEESALPWVAPNAFYSNRIDGVSDHLAVLGIFKLDQ